MTLVTDLAQIDADSRARWADNWNFRQFLIETIEPNVIDAVAQRLNIEVSAKIDCKTCGNCCRESKPTLSDAEVALLARATHTTPAEFTKSLTTIDDEGFRVFAASPCPLLRGKLCSVYIARPEDCAGYPHLDQPNFLAGSIQTIENYRVCPIVYNVYEAMKREFPYDPSVDHIGDKDVEANVDGVRG